MIERQIEFKELLEILNQAEAIQFDGSLVYPAVYEDKFEVSPLDDDESLMIEADDIENLYINDYGNIEFEMGDDVYMISVLVRKELV
jgi:hypothetical protein